MTNSFIQLQSLSIAVMGEVEPIRFCGIGPLPGGHRRSARAAMGRFLVHMMCLWNLVGVRFLYT
jgi:hypothetical protein